MFKLFTSGANRGQKIRITTVSKQDNLSNKTSELISKCRYTTKILRVRNNNDNRVIVLMSRVFANAPGDRGSILGRVILKTENMLLYACLLSTIS